MQLTIEQALQQAVAAHKGGNLTEAENIYRAILQSQPRHADANHNLGVIAISVNQIEAAVPLFKTALDANPNVEQFWLSYVDALVKADRLKDAKQAIKKAKKKGFDAKKVGKLLAQIKISTESDAEVSFKLGNTLMGQGKFSEAEVSYNQAIALKPDFAEAHNNLGMALERLGKFSESEASCNRAIALKPDFVAAHNNLGNALVGLGRLTEAEASFNQAIASKVDYADAHNNLGVVLQRSGRLSEAEASYNQAIALKPDFAEAYNNLGGTLTDLGRLTEAEASFNQAIALNPDYAEAHNNLGVALQRLGRLTEAEASYNQAIALKPDYAEAHNNFGATLTGLGRLEEAEASYNQAIALEPDFAEAYRMLTHIKKFQRQDERFSKMLELYRDNALPDERRSHLNFGLAKVHEDLGDFERAFTHYSEGNELRKKLLGYHVSKDVELFMQLKASYPRIEQASLEPEKSSKAPTPIFIVGMPRSGTTLVEQIVSSHPLVTGAGELPYVNLFGSTMATGCSDISHQGLLDFRNSYLDKLQGCSEGNLWITDKMPHNFRYLGLLAAAFPEAKLIHVKRRPEAVCWGNFKTYFSNNLLGYAWAIDDIVVFYNLYQSLMNFWKNALGYRIYNLDYELLTDNQESETRKLIDFIGLNWEERCLYPEGNKRSVSTASSVQVRQKVYRGSSDQWRTYEPFLDGAFAGLSR